MAELLELAHLVDEHRVAQMQIRCGRIEPRLDAQRLATRQFLLEFGLDEQLRRPAAKFVQLIFDAVHVDPPCLRGYFPRFGECEV